MSTLIFNGKHHHINGLGKRKPLSQLSNKRITTACRNYLKGSYSNIKKVSCSTVKNSFGVYVNVTYNGTTQSCLVF